MNASLKSFLQFPLVKIIAGITVCMGAVILIKNFIAQPVLYSLLDNKILADTIKNCISFSVLLISYYLFSKYYERKKLVELSVQNLTGEMFGGLTLGFFTITVSIFILYLLGCYRIISVSTANYSLKLFTLLLTAALVEDLLIRGLIIRVLENWLGTYITLIIAMLFETWHLFNPNSSIASGFMDLVWGFTMAILYVYTKRIWLPFFFHVGWNFAQPFYGSNLSGLEDMGTIIESKFNGPLLLTGGKTGIEGSIFAIILLSMVGIVFFHLSKKEGKFVKRKTDNSQNSGVI
ncbi:MAG: CPBP family intramembrane metalloprotease [Chitinophagaceae bacterium]|nr:CPBP family intramembrane metalloprotease [Chitinophagaceae bacterium]